MKNKSYRPKMINNGWQARLVVTLSLLLLSDVATFGQSTTGSITGTVNDANRAAVPGVTVTVTNPANNVTRTVTTGDDGGFSVPQLPPGTYTVTVEKQGFSKLEKTGVILNAADLLNAGDLTLAVGTVGETVTVQADAGQLQIKSESGERADLISNRQIKDLALNGRNLLDLVKVIPGVVSNVNGQVAGPQGLSQFNINGTRGNQKELTIDGSSNVDTGANGSIQVTINPDAVAEVKILTSNFQAEYGKAGGGSILYVTKSGTREFHGTGRYFRRHDSLNANDFFRNAEGSNPDGSARQPRPLYRYDYYGYDIGGPIYIPGTNFNRNNDKLFFFFNQEYYRQLVPAGTRNIRVPTQAERNGDFSDTRDALGRVITIRDPQTGQPFPGNLIPRERFFANGQAILSIYPLPNFTGSNQFNYTSAVSNPNPRREDVIRIDYNISDRTRLTARVINNYDEQRQPYGLGQNFTLTRNVMLQPGINGALTLFHTFTPTLTNEFIFGPSHSERRNTPEDDRASRAANNITFAPLFPNVTSEDYIPNFRYGGIANQTFPDTGFSAAENANNTFNFIDNLTKVAGAHTIKTGIFVQRNRKDQASSAPYNANINFNNDANNPLNTNHPFANALLGLYQQYQQTNNRITAYLRYTNLEGYVQDTWRVRPRLTLDYGVRLSYYQPQFDDRLQLNYFNPDLFDRARAVRLYEPVLVGTQTRAVDPSNRPTNLTAGNTLPNNFVGLIVPSSGDIANGVGQASKGYPKAGFTSERVLFGPRLGFAYDVTGRGTTVVRGGFGVAYDRVGGNQGNQAISNPPNAITPRLTFGRLDDLSTVSPAAIAPPDITGTPRDGKIPTVYSYSLSVQRNIGFGTVVDIAYVGTQSRHLGQQRNLNAIPYGATFLRENQDPTRFAGGIVPTVEPNLPAVYSQAGLSFSGTFAKRIEFLRPFSGFGTINYREYVGASNYNSLQVQVTRRFSQGFTFGMAYTFSKVFDTANTDTDSTNPFNTRAYDYKLADFDRTHVFVVNYVYDLPKFSRYLGSFGDNAVARAIFDNYQISGITQLSTGTPFELGFGIQGITAGQRITGSYTEAPRFNLRSNPQAGGSGLLIDPNAFVVPAIGSVGLGSRQYLRNPGVNNHDISIFKNFPFGGEGARYLQLRFEMFNAFNHTQFSGINSGTQLTTSAGAIGNAIFSNYNDLTITNNLRPDGSTVPLGRFFGEYNNARDPRIIQLGVKLYF